MTLRYFRILKQRDFSLLWFGQIISQFGDRLTQIALVGLVSKATMSSSSLAFTMSMAIVPVFLVSPISGIYIDRWSKRKSMYVSDLLRGIFIFLIPFFFLKFASLFPIYILIFLSFSAGRFFVPAKMAFIPKVVDKKDIFLANSLISITAAIAAVLGFGLGGIIVERFGVTSAFILDAFTFLISAAAIFSITVREKSEFLPTDILEIGRDVVDSVKKSFLVEMKEGIKYIYNSRETRYAFKVFLFLFSYIGGLYVVFIRFIQETLSSVTRDLGFVIVFLGAGIFFGSLFYGRFAHRFSIRRVINFAVFLASLYLIFFVVSLHLYPQSLYAFIHSFILGLVAAPAFVGVNALIHKESDENLLGRIFSGLELISHFGFLIAMFLASFFADLFNTFTIVVAIGIIGSILSLFFILTEKRNDKGRRAQASPA